ncbi:MAG TPA: hypothetical protein VLB80_03860 [Candidatus Babeliales bacterium]|nr:hypothetical protein [Candidatus Babeliales bacterium]
MSINYRELLEKVRDLKIKKDDIPPLKYESEIDLLETPIILTRQHLMNVLKRFMQERISGEDLLNWIHFVWFTDFFTCADEDMNCISGVIHLLEELEEEGELLPEDVAHCLYTLEHNIEAQRLFDDSL